MLPKNPWKPCSEKWALSVYTYSFVELFTYVISCADGIWISMIYHFFCCMLVGFFLFVRKFATLLRVAEEDGDHIYKLHYHMQPLSSGIVAAEDSEDSTILPMAASFKTEELEGSRTIASIMGFPCVSLHNIVFNKEVVNLATSWTTPMTCVDRKR